MESGPSLTALREAVVTSADHIGILVLVLAPGAEILGPGS